MSGILINGSLFKFPFPRTSVKLKTLDENGVQLRGNNDPTWLDIRPTTFKNEGDVKEIACGEYHRYKFWARMKMLYKLNTPIATKEFSAML